MASMKKYFKGSDSVLSNFYPCSLDIGGVRFHSVEHAYQFKKAIFHYDYEMAEEIYFAPDAYEAKRLSKTIYDSPEWCANKLQLMDTLVMEKHRQIPIFRQYLEETNQLQLIHDVSDDFWGTANGKGQNKFGKLLGDVRDRCSPRLKICVFGSSYVKRLYNWCAGDFKVPSVVKLFYKGGMKASAVPCELVNDMLRMRPDVVFLQLGGNDISANREPGEVVGDLKRFVDELKESGVKDVFIGEILQRGDFSKSPGLDIDYFNYCRKFINRRLEKLFGHSVVFFPKIKYPRDYADDKVHLSDRGLKTYHMQLRRLFLSLTK